MQGVCQANKNGSTFICSKNISWIFLFVRGMRKGNDSASNI